VAVAVVPVELSDSRVDLVVVVVPATQDSPLLVEPVAEINLETPAD